MSGDSQTSGQKQSKKFTLAGVQQLQSAFGNLLNNQNFQGSEALGSEILLNPDILGERLVQGLKDNNASDQLGAYEAAIGRTNERAGAQGSYRGGDTRLGERLAAADLGRGIASGNRQIDVTAAEMNRQAQLQAIDTNMKIAQVPYQAQANIGNAYVGAGSSGVWAGSQPSPLETLGGGLGSLAGLALAPSSATGAGIGSRLSGG